MLPAVALGALGASLSVGDSLLSAVLATAAHTLEPFVGAVLLRRAGFRRSLSRSADIASFVSLAGLISTAVGATFGLLSVIVVGGPHSTSALATVWRNWWLADFSGVLIVGAAILVLWDSPLTRMRRREVAETVALVAGGSAAIFVLLSHPGSAPYLVLPVLFLLALVLRERGAAVGALVASAISVLLTVHGHAPFPGGSLDAELMRTETFASVGIVTALLVAAAQSERRIAERAVDRLAESESALAEAQHLARVGSFETDLVSGRATWSQELYRILGRKPSELPPGWHSWRRCIHPEDLGRVEEIVRRVSDERVGTSVIHRIVRPDGQIRTVEARFRFELDEWGAPVRILGTCQDVTPVKLAEERFRSLFDTAPYAILVFDQQGEILLSNARAQRMFGYTAAELAGRPVEELAPTPDGQSGVWYAEVPRAAVQQGAEIELRPRRRDGTTFPAEVSLTPLVCEDGMLISAAIRDVTEMRAAEESLTHEARHDLLTGLPNRLLFLERLELALARARRSDRPLAVVFLDLDDFKAVNDTRGHDVGDLLLTRITPRLKDAVRHGDTLARLGGDEFVVLCEDLPDERQAMELAQRITDISLEPVWGDGFEYSVSVSAGVVLVRDARNASAVGVLRDADAAMYTAKAGGKGRVAMFDEGMRERLLERVAIESALQGAVARGEMELHYQPVVEIERSRVVAIEALLRWRHPIRGLLAPAEFISVAETTGLISEIGEWVIEEACRQAVRWRDLSPRREPVPVSVNLSNHQLTHRNLVGAVQRILESTGLEPNLLVLEVTESSLLEDMATSRQELMRLKELGVQLVVDDFGTGYSSLSVLRNLMVDGLKLDQSFVQALGTDSSDGSMVDAVLSMAGALDAQVTAEGVETWAQASRLRSHGCDYAQGYLFARPAPASELTPLLTGAGRMSEEELAV